MSWGGALFYGVIGLPALLAYFHGKNIIEVLNGSKNFVLLLVISILLMICLTLLTIWFLGYLGVNTNG